MIIPLPYKILAAIAIFLMLTAGYFGWRTHQRNVGATAQKQIDELLARELKDKAANTLADETAKVRAAEKTLRAVLDAQEVQSAKDQKTVSNLSIRLRNLAAVNNGRLRDPYYAGRCGGGGNSPKDGTAASAGDSQGNGASAGGLFSPEFSGFLLNKDDAAERISAAYRSCRAYAFAVSGME